MHTFNPITGKAEAGGVPGQPGLHSEFQDRKDYVERPCLKTLTTAIIIIMNKAKLTIVPMSELTLLHFFCQNIVFISDT